LPSKPSGHATDLYGKAAIVTWMDVQNSISEQKAQKAQQSHHITQPTAKICQSSGRLAAMKISTGFLSPAEK